MVLASAGLACARRGAWGHSGAATAACRLPHGSFCCCSMAARAHSSLLRSNWGLCFTGAGLTCSPARRVGRRHSAFASCQSRAGPCATTAQLVWVPARCWPSLAGIGPGLLALPAARRGMCAPRGAPLPPAIITALPAPAFPELGTKPGVPHTDAFVSLTRTTADNLWPRPTSGRR